MSFTKYRSFMAFWIMITCMVSALFFGLGAINANAATGAGSLSPSDSNSPVPNHKGGNGSGVILMYHHIVPNDLYVSGKFDGNNAVIPLRQFENQMKYLKENGYTTLTMTELAGYLKKGITLPAKTVAITFDDGYESNYVYAYPVLKEYNIKATIAVVVKDTVDISGSPKIFDPSVLSHLTFAQLKEMQNSGLIEIGSHSYDGHKYVVTNANPSTKFFTQKIFLDGSGRYETATEYYQRIDDDLRFSKYHLEKELGTKINYFAYPYGLFNDSVKQALTNNGFIAATTVKTGTINKNSSLLQLNRKNVAPNITMLEYAKLVNTQ